MVSVVHKTSKRNSSHQIELTLVASGDLTEMGGAGGGSTSEAFLVSGMVTIEQALFRAG